MAAKLSRDDVALYVAHAYPKKAGSPAGDKIIQLLLGVLAAGGPAGAILAGIITAVIAALKTPTPTPAPPAPPAA